MEGLLVLAGLGLLLGVLFGWIAFFRVLIVGGRLHSLHATVESLERRLARLEGSATKAGAASVRVAAARREDDGPQTETVVAADAETASEPGVKEPPRHFLPSELACDEAGRPVPMPPAIPTIVPQAAAPKAEPAWTVPRGPDLFERIGREGLEQVLGRHVIVWVAIAMVVVSGGLFLKYAFDNAWIGPMGRVALWAGVSALGLILGDRARKAGYAALFQALTGGGIAGFYTTIYFAMHVYHLISAEASFGLGCLVTLFGVFIAVARHAQPLAIVALLGGFMSPFLFSTGQDRPHALFTYLLMLDGVALGAALFRRWRWLNLLAFTGTMLLYQAWLHQYGLKDPLSTGLLYATAFYLFFLAVPSVYGLLRREAGRPEDTALVVASTVAAVISYYTLLYRGYPMELSFTVIGMAVLTLLLFVAWMNRVGRIDPTSRSLLVLTLLLVTIAAPIQLRGHALALVWAAQGVALAYASGLFRDLFARGGSVLALALATMTLLGKGALHSAPFTPLFNGPFAVWALLATAWGVSAWLIYLRPVLEEELERLLVVVFSLVAFALGTALLSMETGYWWQFVGGLGDTHWRAHQIQSLLVLWSAITIATVLVADRFQRAFIPLGWVCAVVTALVVLSGVPVYRAGMPVLIFNPAFLSHALFLAVLWGMAWLFWHRGEELPAKVLELAGHVLVVALSALELLRWAHESEVLTGRMAISLMSAVWAVQALALVFQGLLTRQAFRRAAGMLLFGLTVAKVILYDTAMLEQFYRVLSWLACGVLLLVAAYFYQRFSAVLTERAGLDGEERKS